MTRGLIVTADDFGAHPAVNEAVERAGRHGGLDAASLMVGGSAAADAVERARGMPGLAVGLHVVLTDGRPVLPAARIPDLVDGAGNFRPGMVREAFRMALLPRVRRQLAAEIKAQFEAFAATGLPLDHVNAHKHFHLHPLVLSLILSIGRDFGLRAMRCPQEPGTSPWWRPWLQSMRQRCERAGVACNDQVFGVARSGAMDEATLLSLAWRLPPGVTEIYLHPATASGTAISPSMAGYRHEAELRALLSDKVRAAFDATRALRGGFAAVLRRMRQAGADRLAASASHAAA